MLQGLQKSLLFIFILIGQQLVGQVKFTVTVSPNLIGKTDFAQLKLIIENGVNIEKINPPDLKNFDVQSGPNEETGITSINGNVKKYYAQSYIIKPKTNGTFVIPPTTALVDGAIYKSNPVVLKVSIKATLANSTNTLPFGKLEVTEQPKQNYNEYILKKGENITEKVKRNMFVKVDVNKTNCFVGEPIVVTYKLFTRLKSESNIIKNPSFNGFSVIDLEQPNALIYETEKVNGKEYNVYTIRKSQLYPLQPGVFSLEEAEVENVIHFIREDYLKNRAQNFFDDFGQTPLPLEALEDYKIVLKNNVVNIVVKPLPTSNVPKNFKGAVGDFGIIAQLEKNICTTDETIKLKILLSGEGNLQLITAPEINWPKYVELFEPKFTENLFKNTIPISGSKTSEYPFSVDSVGTFTLDTLSFTFFDVKSGKYKTIYANPIVFTVIKGNGLKNTITTKNYTQHKNWVSTIFNNRKVVIGAIALLLLSGLFFWLKKEERTTNKKMVLREDEKVQQEGIAEKQQEVNKDWLVQAKNCLHTNDEINFYTFFSTELKEFMIFKTGIDKANFNTTTVTAWLAENKINTITCNQYKELATALEMYLYNPFAEKMPMEMMYEKGIVLIRSLTT
jgi:BatD DUF11 like domain